MTEAHSNKDLSPVHGSERDRCVCASFLYTQYIVREFTHIGARAHASVAETKDAILGSASHPQFQKQRIRRAERFTNLPCSLVQCQQCFFKEKLFEQ